MDIQQLRDLANTRPFVRFIIALSSGKNVEVPTSDHIFFVPGQPVVIAVDENGRFHIIAMSSVAELIVEKIN